MKDFMMKKLTELDIVLLDNLIKSELEIIEKGFMISEMLGKVFLSNAINEFKDVYLKNKYGEIIPSMSTEYRYFILGILKTINDEFKELVIQEVLIPTIGKVPTDELLKILNDTGYREAYQWNILNF